MTTTTTTTTNAYTVTRKGTVVGGVLTWTYTAPGLSDLTPAEQARLVAGLTTYAEQPALVDQTAAWAVFPVAALEMKKETDKKYQPLCKWREDSAPRDEWVGRWPSRTGSGKPVAVGIDCGKSGLVVLDEDSPGGVAEWLDKAAPGRSLPETYTVRTSRGSHFYYLAATGRVVRDKTLLEGLKVDVRGEGGLVIGAGSVHPWQGAVYTVVNDMPVQPMPDWLVDLLADPLPTTITTASVFDLDLSRFTARFELPDVIEEGQRNDTLHTYACSLVGRPSIRPGEALDLLKVAYGHCRVPYTEETAEHLLLRTLEEYGTAETVAAEEGRIVPLTPLEVAREARLQMLRSRGKAMAIEELSRDYAEEWFGTTAEDFDPSTLEPVPKVLTYGHGQRTFAAGVTLLYGHRNSAKTWLAYEACRQELEKGHRALIIDYELSRDEAIGRLYTLGMTREDAVRLVYVHPSTPIGDASRTRLLERFGDTPPTVVVLDSLGMGMGLSAMDSNSDTDTARWANEVVMWLKATWPCAVVLVIDHLPKAGGSEPIGSQRKGALADALFRVETVTPFTRKVTGSCRVTVEKDRRGWFEAGKALFDLTFGGGVPFTIVETEKGSILVDMGDALALQRHLATYVGQHEGCRVEDARKVVGGGHTEFTALKENLVALRVIEHRPRVGLFKGPAWDVFSAASPE